MSQTVAQCMNRDLLVTNKNVTANQAIELLLKNNISHLILVDENKLTGVVSEKDFLEKLASLRTWRIDIGSLHVSSFVKRKPFWAHPNMRLNEMISIMLKENYGAVPVVDSGRVIGLITKEDLLKALKLPSKLAARDVATQRLITLSVQDRAAYARRIIVDKLISAIPVVDKFKIIGILTDIRLLHALKRLYELTSWVERKARFRRLIVQDIYERTFPEVAPETPIADLIEMFLSKHLKAVFVTEERNLLGIVTKSDLLVAAMWGTSNAQRT